MSWLSVRYHPGFVDDLTSWTTTIERKGKLVQRVESWPEHRTFEHRVHLSSAEVAELVQLIDAVNFQTLSDRQMRGVIVDDVGSVAVAVKSHESVLGFDAPLLYWAWARACGSDEYLPAFDFDPALRLWEAVNRCSPHRLSESCLSNSPSRIPPNPAS